METARWSAFSANPSLSLLRYLWRKSPPSLTGTVRWSVPNDNERPGWERHSEPWLFSLPAPLPGSRPSRLTWRQAPLSLHHQRDSHSSCCDRLQSVALFPWSYQPPRAAPPTTRTHAAWSRHGSGMDGPTMKSAWVLCAWPRPSWSCWQPHRDAISWEGMPVVEAAAAAAAATSTAASPPAPPLATSRPSPPPPRQVPRDGVREERGGRGLGGERRGGAGAVKTSVPAPSPPLPGGV